MGVVAAIALFVILFLTRTVVFRSVRESRLGAAQAALAMFGLYFAVPFVIEFGLRNGSNPLAAAIGGTALGVGAGLGTYILVNWWHRRQDAPPPPQQ